jgi:protein-S-isoprenylcysteine O-methyltransferase Ste14
MIPQIITGILLAIPAITLLILSPKYWHEFKKSIKIGKKPKYKNLFYYLLVAGDLCNWVFWYGGSILLVLNKFYDIFGFLRFSLPHEMVIQTCGFFIFYIGAITYNWVLFSGGKYILPSTSGLLGNHKLVQKGPYGIIRHPLYVAYIFILAGLSLILLIYWLLIPTLFIIIGIYPTAKAEEEILIEQFGEEYIEYKRKVGMFLPKLRKLTR